MPLGNPTPPLEPVPPPVGGTPPLPPERGAGPFRSWLQGFTRYWRYRMLLQQRKNRKPKAPSPLPATHSGSGDHPAIDRLA